MSNLSSNLNIDRCPHCSIATPNLQGRYFFNTSNHLKMNLRYWGIYICSNCGGVVTAYAQQAKSYIEGYFPSLAKVHEDIPDRAKNYLSQAIDSIHAPAGAIMLAASSVDAMLKEKEYFHGSLYSRIKKAVDENLLTSEMGSWANEIRLDANDQRHADEDEPMPTEQDARKVIEFASAIAEYLFVLPAKVQRGLKNKGHSLTNE